MIKRIQKSVKRLTDNLNFLKKKIEESYYECRDVDFDELGVVEGSFYGYTKREVFETYVYNNYGQSINPRGRKYNGKDIVEIRAIDFSSQIWEKQYGIAYGSNFEYGSNCFVSRKSEVGRITKITKNSIYVREKSTDIQLVIGSCSVL